MLQYATWKYVLAAILIALSAFYSLPNLYPQDPAVQIAANRGSVIDDSLALRVRGALEAAKVEAKSVAVEGDNLRGSVRRGCGRLHAGDLVVEFSTRRAAVATPILAAASAVTTTSPPVTPASSPA